VLEQILVAAAGIPDPPAGKALVLGHTNPSHEELTEI